MRTQLSFSTYFTLRMDKEKAGTAPLYLAVTVNREKCMIALRKQVDVKIWDTGRGMAKGFKGDAKELNSYLNEVRTAVTNLYSDLQLKGKRVTAQSLKNLFLGEEELVTHSIN